jgi:hypothetical protein
VTIAEWSFYALLIENRPNRMRSDNPGEYGYQ